MKLNQLHESAILSPESRRIISLAKRAIARDLTIDNQRVRLKKSFIEFAELRVARTSQYHTRGFRLKEQIFEILNRKDEEFNHAYAILLKQLNMESDRQAVTSNDIEFRLMWEKILNFYYSSFETLVDQYHEDN
jgi:hypothetical protein